MSEEKYRILVKLHKRVKVEESKLRAIADELASSTTVSEERLLEYFEALGRYEGAKMIYLGFYKS